MSLNKESGKQNVYNLIEFLESNKDASERVDCMGGSVDPTVFNALDAVYEPNQAFCLESDTEVSAYLLLDINKLLRIGYEKNGSCVEPMAVKYTLYPNADKLMIKTGKSAKEGKLVYIYYSGGSKINEQDEYMSFYYRAKLPKIACLSDMVVPISIEQIRTRIANLPDSEELDFVEENKIDESRLERLINEFLNGFQTRVIPMFPDYLEESDSSGQLSGEPVFTLDPSDTKGAEEAISVKLNSVGGKGRVRLRHKKGE